VQAWKNDVKLTSSEECDASFEQLKLNLTTAQILAKSQDTGVYTLDIDASKWAAGAVLQQERDGLSDFELQQEHYGFRFKTLPAIFARQKVCYTYRPCGVILPDDCQGSHRTAGPLGQSHE